MAKKNVINEYHGLFIGLSCESIHESLVDMLKSKAKEKYEVTVSLDGQIKHLSFKSFLKKLGFKIKF